MGASAVTNGGCSSCCSQESRGQLNFGDVGGGGGGGEAVLPELGVDPLSEFAKTSNCVYREASAPSRSPSIPPLPDTPDGAHENKPTCFASPGSAGKSDDSVSEGGQDSAASTEADSGELRLLVEHFVRGLVRGTKVSAVSGEGDLVECLLSIDPAITELTVQRVNVKGNKKRTILLREIRKVCLGSDVESEGALPLDDTCVALHLEDGHFVGFSFPCDVERVAFMRCLSMFVGDERVSLKTKLNKAPSPAPETRGPTGQCAGVEDERFGLEDPECISVPDCQETVVPFAFQVGARGSSAEGSEVGK